MLYVGEQRDRLSQRPTSFRGNTCSQTHRTLRRPQQHSQRQSTWCSRCPSSAGEEWHSPVQCWASLSVNVSVAVCLCVCVVCHVLVVCDCLVTERRADPLARRHQGLCWPGNAGIIELVYISSGKSPEAHNTLERGGKGMEGGRVCVCVWTPPLLSVCICNVGCISVNVGEMGKECVCVRALMYCVWMFMSLECTVCSIKGDCMCVYW